MAIALPDARQLSDEVLEALRTRAVRGFIQRKCDIAMPVRRVVE
jgi:hypothetical protein